MVDKFRNCYLICSILMSLVLQNSGFKQKAWDEWVQHAWAYNKKEILAWLSGEASATAPASMACLQATASPTRRPRRRPPAGRWPVPRRHAC